MVILSLVGIVGYVVQGTNRHSVDHSDTTRFFANGMSPNLTTAQQPTEFSELADMLNETIGPDEWFVVGPSTHAVNPNDLVEVDESDSEYSLIVQLCRRDQVLTTQHRYFGTYRGPDGEIEDRPREYLACAMYSNGFLSGSCEVKALSDTEVALTSNWTFDDKDAGMKSEFNCTFNAMLGSSGEIDCGNDAKLRWTFERNATKQSDAPKPPNGAN